MRNTLDRFNANLVKYGVAMNSRRAAIGYILLGVIFVLRVLLLVLVVGTFLSIVHRFAVVAGLTGDNRLLLIYLPIGAWMVYFGYRKIWPARHRPDSLTVGDPGIDSTPAPAPAIDSTPAPAAVRPIEPVRPIPSRPPDSVRTNEDLTAELIEIGRRPQPASGTTWFLSSARSRAREIGEVLNERGGMDLMLQAHSIVGQALRGASGRELEVAWDGIGDWMG